MRVEEFFEKAKTICNFYIGKCGQCPIGEYCSDGIFSSNLKERTEMIQSVEKAYERLQKSEESKCMSS